MPRKAKDVTDAELAILRVLWESKRATVRAVATQVYPDEPTKQVPTVQKLLGRLESKSCVTRDRSVWPHLYSAAVVSDELVGRRLEATADQLCGGSFAPLLEYILRRRPIDSDEETLLRQYMEERRGGARTNGERDEPLNRPCVHE
ncbi:MAG: BlaI/MecI/CopY family transcriptional regulator [Planctomycetaceae bacterium]